MPEVLNSQAPGADETVTLIIKHSVKAGFESAYEAWLRNIVRVAGQREGHLGVDVVRGKRGRLGGTPEQPALTIVDAQPLHDVGLGLGLDAFGHDPLYDLAHSLEQAAAVRLGPKGIYPNVDFYSGLVYRKLGIPVDLFTPIFAIARMSGWTAHVLEQWSDNRIFRPLSEYTGRPYGQKVVPIADRE